MISNNTNFVSVKKVFFALLCSLVFAANSYGQYTTAVGPTTNNAGNSAIPSAGSGNCAAAPQNTTGTFFTLNSTVAGTLGTNFTVKAVKVRFNHTWNSDLSIYLRTPGNQVIALSTQNGGSGDNMNIWFCDNAAASITSVTGGNNITGEFRPEGGTINTCGSYPTPALTGTTVVNTLAGLNTGSTAGNWELHFADHFTGDAGTLLEWTVLLEAVPAVPCTIGGVTNGGTIAAVNVSSCPGQSAVPFTYPAAPCAAGVITYEFRVGTTGAWSPVPTGANTTISGLVAGANTVQYRLSPCIAQVSQTVNYSTVDNVAPTIACPANVTVNLPPGACDASVVLAPAVVTDNCPPVGIIANVTFGTQPAGWTTSSTGPGAVPAALFNFNHNGVVVGGTANPAFTLPILHINDDGAGNTYNPAISRVTTNNYDLSNALNPVLRFDWQNEDFLGSGQTIAEVSGDGGTTWTVLPGFPITLDAKGTTTYPVPAALRTNQFRFRFTYDDEGAWAWGAGLDNFAITADAVYPISNNYNSNGANASDVYPIGTTVVVFTGADAAGTTATCSTTVTVNEFANPTAALACNDLVQISLDEDCSVAVGADQILEGGPYGCYDDYIVEVDRTPQGNGPWAPAVLGPNDIGKTYDVRVTDPVSGNSCWGKIKVEDKLAPVLDCKPVLLPCNFNTAPQFSQSTSLTLPFSATQSLPVSLPDLTTRTFDIPVGLAGQVVDVDFRVRVSGDVWFGNIAMDVTSPAGTVVTSWNGIGGCTGPIAVRFDDEGATALACANFTTDVNAAIPFGLGVLSSFDGQAAAGNWRVRISDTDGFGDVSSIEVVELIITIQGTFSAGFPNGLVLNSTVFPTAQANVFTVPAGNDLDNCSAVTLSYTDETAPEDCASGLTSTITRTWVAVDASGNSSTCEQEIEKLRPSLSDVVLPSDYDGVDEPYLACGSQFPTPAVMNALGLEGTPRVFGSTDGCSINWDYEDLVIAVCDGTYKIKRTWTIIDWCTGTGFDYVQLIKVADDAGPSIATPANLTVSTDPYTCCATVDLPNVIVADACSRINNVGGFITGFDPNTGEVIGTFPISGTLTSFPGNNLWTPDTLANYGFTPCLPLGTHTVTYIATDDCGNTASATFRLTVRDFTQPTVASDELTVVSIGLDDPFDCYVPNAQPGDCQAGGISWVKASTFDDGSYDNCGAVKFTIQRMQPYSDCILALNGTNGFDVNGPNPDGGASNCFDIFPDFPSEFERAITEGDSIKFYCCEVGTTQQVIFRVYQLNPDGSFSIGPDGLPIVNSTMVNVEVQDKLKPTCQAPANVTVSCEAFDPSLWAYGNAVPSDNCCLDTTKVYQGQCGLSHTTVLTQFDSLCNKGTITRRWTAFDCHGQTSQCTQRIIVTYNQNYWVKFPADRLVSTCDGTTAYGAPEFYGEDCELLATSYTDEFFTVIPDACYKIERTWRVINWCTYNPNNPTCQFVPNPNPNNTTNHPTNLPGVTVSAPGTTVPGWLPTVVRINPTDPQPTNYSTFWNKETNCYTYKQIIKVFDTQDPTVAPAPTEFCDLSTNDPQFYNAMQYWDAGIASHDLCEGDANIEITATDACSGAALNFRYLLFLDLDGNGSMETVVNSVAPLAYNTLFYGNATAPNYVGGTAWNFDFRPVPSDRKWAFGLQVDNANGNSRTARVRWVNQVGQNAVPQLPYGNHKIKWFVEDGCGNETIYEHNVVVKDCKKPTVVCLNGLSVNLMNVDGGMIALWASDFLQYTEDNCTPANLIKIGIRRVGQADGQGNTTGFPKNADGTPQTRVNFTCADLGTQLVELWGLDVAGNADYCETYVLIQDNAGVCGNNADIAGALKNEAAQGVEDANVELDGSANGVPAFAEVFSQATGDYVFSNALPFAGNATVTPTLELDPLNGVNTWDLILISRHILGLEPLNTPYKLISADANKSGTVTTFDIVELRKLILGTYQQLPNNSSWRFVDKTQVFTNPANPFADVIRENLQIANIQTNVSNGDFVAAKIGDVDGTATPNNLVSSDDRTAGTLLFDIEDRAVKAGETFTVNFKAADKAAGYQFTMNTTNLEVMDILPGEKMTTENFAVFADAITTSADDTKGEFAVTFRATANGQLSNMLAVSSRITKAVAFDGTSKLNVAFRFNNGGNSTIAGVGFELYQNSPNPFVNKTFVGFHLPEATSATLSVYDETGRVLYTTTGDFGKGYNAIALDRTTLNANGVLYYKLETTTDSATKKMIQTSK